MYLVERFWGVVTTVFSIVSLTPLQDNFDSQITLSTSLTSSLPVALKKDYGGTPEFDPPGAPHDPNFKCEYPHMEGWEDCSTSNDRRCWLRNRKTGEQFDITTDYENKWPTGIERHYKIDINDSWWAADGKNFSDAKLFNHTYPGPWIQACWGDR